MELDRDHIKIGNKLRILSKRIWSGTGENGFETGTEKRNSLVEITKLFDNRFEYKVIDCKRENPLPNSEENKLGRGSTTYIIFDKDGKLRDKYKDQYFLAEEGFEFNGVWITDPTKSECGRFEVDPKEYYGIDK